MNDGYTTLRVGLAKSNLQTLDLDDAIRHETSTLFIDNAHFGDRGYGIMGDYIASYLLKTNMKVIEACGPQN